MSINPKAKGSGFERDIAKFLTEWLTGQSKEYYFWRSPGSGGIATVLEANGTIAGDIIALKPEGTRLTNLYAIECKKGYPQSSVNKFMNSKEDELAKFWKQTCEAASKGNRSPMLFYHKKGMNCLVAVCTQYSELKHISIHNPSFENWKTAYFYDSKEFFKYHSPNFLLDTKKD